MPKLIIQNSSQILPLYFQYSAHYSPLSNGFWRKNGRMILIHLVSGKTDYLEYRLLEVNYFSVHPTLIMVGNYYNDYSWIWRYDTSESNWQGFPKSFVMKFSNKTFRWLVSCAPWSVCFVLHYLFQVSLPNFKCYTSTR